MDLHKQQFTIDIGGAPLTLEVSKIAEQATAAVIGQYGDTVVLTTVVMSDKEKDIDYFPLTVNFEERHYAAGKIMGSRFVRREARPSDEAILSGRLVDRTIRPLFDQRMRREVQVVSTVLSVDGEHDPDFVALITASVALGISPIPWDGPVAGVKISKLAGDPTIHINTKEMQLEAGMEFTGFVSGTANEINMIEFEGLDVKEEDMVRAAEKAQEEIKRLVAFEEDIIKKIGEKKIVILKTDAHEKLREMVRAFVNPKLHAALYVSSKSDREERMAELGRALTEHLTAEGVAEHERGHAKHFYEEAIDEMVHEEILKNGKRPDGRRMDEVRELHAEVALFKRLHGSALFVRGNTQALAVVTLAPPSSELLVETMDFSGKRRFLLHYNFPPYSVGETGPFRGPGRREIGHGTLAAKAVRNLIPVFDEFPYTIRVVSEILSSNGSSSMATVCATILALMDAGVPIKKPAAGIAMGMMSETSSKVKGKSEKYKILTDIQGPEDHYGDMDLKVAGTKDGITAIQMDVKINGITAKMLHEALLQAKAARLHILETVTSALPAPRKELSPFAPVIVMVAIPPLKIGELIGPGGKIINGIIAKTGVITIDIEEDGKVFIAGDTREKVDAALREVNGIMREFAVGDMVEGNIIKILDFGAIVDLGGGRDGMIHVSELKQGFVKKVEDVVKLGDFVRAKVVRVEDGRIGLSLKGV